MNNLRATKKKALFLLMAVFWGGLTGYAETASAASISGAGCLNNSCYGGTYELYYSGTGGVAGYDITYILNTVNLDHNVAGDYLNTVGFKVVANSLASISLTSAPGGVSLWTPALPDSSVNASNGCSTTGSGGFGCTEWVVSPNSVGVPTGVAGAIYTFLFHITTNPNDPLLLGANQASIKAVFADVDPRDGSVKAQGLLSEGITLTQSCTSNCGGGGGGQGSVPEPDAIALIGIGLLGMGLSRKARS